MRDVKFSEIPADNPLEMTNSYYPKSNYSFDNKRSKPKSAGGAALPPASDNFSGKSETEMLREIQAICQLFPKGDKLREAAEKQARRFVRP